MQQNTYFRMDVPSGYAVLHEEDREQNRTERKAEVSVSKKDRQTTFGFLSIGFVAKNKEQSVQEKKKKEKTLKASAAKVTRAAVDPANRTSCTAHV